LGCFGIVSPEAALEIIIRVGLARLALINMKSDTLTGRLVAPAI
jgi:hypothetical protein